MVRHKNRYMVVEINNPNKDSTSSLTVTSSCLIKAIVGLIQQLHGDFGVAATSAGFTAKYCNEKTRIAIIRSRHGPHKLVASVIPFITKLDSKSVTVNILYVGATIRHCFKFIQRHHQKKIEELCASLKTDEERSAIKELLRLDSVFETMKKW